jgi:DNA-binding beta-propeller fold protein YncE
MHLRLAATATVLSAGLTVPTAGAAEPAALELRQTIPLESGTGRYDHLALDDAHGRLFLANLSNNSLDVVDLKAGKLVKQVPGQKKIQGVAYAADLDRIFVGNGGDGACRVFDGHDYSLVKSIPVPDADNVRYRADTHTVYVTGEGGLTVIDAKTMTVTTTVRLPGSPEAHQLDSGRDRLFVNTHKPAQVAVVDLKANKVAAEYKLDSAEANYPMALDPDSGRVFVGCRKKPCLIALDAKTGKELAVVPIPGDTDDLYYDAKRGRLYVICGGGRSPSSRNGGGRSSRCPRRSRRPSSPGPGCSTPRGAFSTSSSHGRARRSARSCACTRRSRDESAWRNRVRVSAGRP